MILADVSKSASGKITAFTVQSHGDNITCAAVSMLVLNTVNSIKKLAPDDFSCEYDPKGGFLTFALTEPYFVSEAANVLLEAMLLGLMSTLEQYPKEITLKVKAVIP
jgi:uncharacterized protein YsxB (DUF464 family)